MSLLASLAARLWKIWTYRWRFDVAGRTYDARLESGWRKNIFTVAADGQSLATETLPFYVEDFRMQELRVVMADGDLILQTAPHNWYTYGLRVSRAGEVVYQSHADPFAYLETLRAIATFGKSDAGKIQKQRAREFLPSMAVDFALGLLLYFAASYMSLREAALIGAGAGLLLHAVQWALDRLVTRKIDLTGGLSTFAILLLLLSAGLAWLIESDLAIQLRSSVLGLIGAACLAIDAWLGGHYFGKRVARYITFIELDPQRLSWGLALVSAALALCNGTIAFGLSRDVWLFYKYWVSPGLGMGLGLWALLRARKPSPAQRDPA